MAPKRLGSAIGIIGTIGNVPLAIGPALGLALYGHGGPGYLFWPAIVLGLLGLAFSVALRLPRPANVGQQTLSLGFDLRWTGPLIANGLQGVYFGAILAYLPLVLAQSHGPNAGIFFAADALGVVACAFPPGCSRTEPVLRCRWSLALP
jgi:hypothetical protein